MVHCFKSSVAIELALLCCSNHHMQIPCTSCKDTIPCQQGAPVVGQGELSWKCKNSNNPQCCQNLIFGTFYCLFLSVPPAVPQNSCSTNTLQSHLLQVSYLPTRASVPPNVAALCTYSLLDNHIQAQCSKIWEAESFGSLSASPAWLLFLSLSKLYSPLWSK